MTGEPNPRVTITERVLPPDDPIYQEPWTIWVPQGIEYSKEPGEASSEISDSTPGIEPLTEDKPDQSLPDSTQPKAGKGRTRGKNRPAKK